LTVSAYLNMSDQNFENVFNPKERDTNIGLLAEQITDLSKKIDDEIESATEKEDYETADALTKMKKVTNAISVEAENLEDDDVTDKRYQLEDKKRKIAQEVDVATKDKRIKKSIELYHQAKSECKKALDEAGNDHERNTFNNIVSQEESFMCTNNTIRIQEKTEEIQGISRQILWRTPDYLTAVFNWLKEKRQKMNDQSQAKSLIDAGEFAVTSENWDRLGEINGGLCDLLPAEKKEEMTTKIGFLK